MKTKEEILEENNLLKFTGRDYLKKLLVAMEQYKNQFLQPDVSGNGDICQHPFTKVENDKLICSDCNEEINKKDGEVAVAFACIEKWIEDERTELKDKKKRLSSMDEDEIDEANIELNMLYRFKEKLEYEKAKETDR